MEQEYNLKGHTGFFLEKLTIRKDKVLGDNFEIDLSDKDDIIKQDGLLANPYSTIIIGSNGTGKSYLLKLIADIFLQIEALEKETDHKYTDAFFKISYYNHGDHFIVQNYSDDFFITDKKRKKVYTVTKNNDSDKGKEYKHKPFAPSAILVSSVLLTDRFTIFKEPSESYKYLGVRNLNSPSSAGTRNYVKRTVDHIVNALSDLNTEFVYKLEELLKYLKFKNTLVIYYTPKYKTHFFKEDLTVSDFKSLFQNFNDETKGFSKRVDSDRIPNNVKYYNNHVAGNNDLISDLVDFLKEIKLKHLKSYEKTRTEYIEFDVIKRELSLDKYKLIKILNSLDLISYPTISLIKDKGNEFENETHTDKDNQEENPIDLEETSSGEYHLISTMIGLFASMSHNSLVLIDEPEISLHPNWQMKYMKFLKSIFKDYSSSHFLIASHSHFLVSDLKGNTSFISGLKRENNELTVIPMTDNTYGWSAEDVLYNIFNVRSSLNHYLKQDLAELLGIISNQIKEKESVTRILNKLYKIEKRKNDPLQEIIIEAEEYLKTIN